MSKLLTIACLLIAASSVFATQQTHVVTLKLVETTLWHEGVVPQKRAKHVQVDDFTEELSVALGLLEER